MRWKLRLLLAGGVIGPMAYLSTLLNQSEEEMFLGPVLGRSLASAVALGSLGLVAGSVIDIVGRRRVDRPVAVSVVEAPRRPDPVHGRLVTVLVRRDGEPIRLQYAAGDEWIEAFEAGTGHMVDRHAPADGVERTPRHQLRVGSSTYEIDRELADRAEVDAFIAAARA